MSNQISLRHYRYFIAVAEELHFRKAAERLFISQPGLSRQIKQMEEILKIDLFVRNNKRVALTEAGKHLYKEVLLILEHLERTEHFGRLIHQGIAGEVKIAYVGSAMQEVIPQILILFRRDHKNIRFLLSEMDNKKQVTNLLKQEVDIGFVRLQTAPPRLEIMPIWEETFSLVVPTDHYINEENFESLNQLADEYFILFEKEYSLSYYETLMSIFEDVNLKPLVSHSSVHANTIFRLVENNFGISIVPTSLKLGYDMNIRFIELKKIRQRAILSVVWNKENTNHALKTLLEVVHSIV